MNIRWHFSAYFWVCNLDETLFSSTVVEIPYKVELKIGYPQGWTFQYESQTVDFNITEKANSLNNLAGQPEGLMKILMHLLCLIWGDYTSGE